MKKYTGFSKVGVIFGVLAVLLLGGQGRIRTFVLK